MKTRGAIEYKRGWLPERYGMVMSGAGLIFKPELSVMLQTARARHGGLRDTIVLNWSAGGGDAANVRSLSITLSINAVRFQIINVCVYQYIMKHPRYHTPRSRRKR